MKELKVSIPVRYHLQLHTLKVLEGRQIHAVVQEALNGYFAALRQPTEDAPAADAADGQVPQMPAADAEITPKKSLPRV